MCKTVKGVFEATSLCPYTGSCESYRAIVNGERWMEKALSDLRRSGKEKLPKSEGGYTDHVLMNKLSQLRRVKDRCYNHNGRCLRFWQFDRKSKEEQSMRVMRERIRPNYVEPPQEPILAEDV
jgi:hypothetical protein